MAAGFLVCKRYRQMSETKEEKVGRNHASEYKAHLVVEPILGKTQGECEEGKQRLA
jgi:hypothetical protein